MENWKQDLETKGLAFYNGDDAHSEESEGEQSVGSILDKPNPILVVTTNKDEYNPSVETVNKILTKVIDSDLMMSGFTLTLKKKYHNDDDKYIHRLIATKLIKSKIWNNKSYVLFPEYSAKGNLHYHGVMWNEYQFEVMRCVKWWRRHFGFVKPEMELHSKYNWLKYIIKDYGKTGLWTLHNNI